MAIIMMIGTDGNTFVDCVTHIGSVQSITFHSSAGSRRMKNWSVDHAWRTDGWMEQTDFIYSRLILLPVIELFKCFAEGGSLLNMFYSRGPTRKRQEVCFQHLSQNY